MDTSPNKTDIKPFWCVAANIVRERLYGPSGTWTSRGTKNFAPGAKVYLLGFYWGIAGEVVTVVGRHRGSHRYITMDLSTACLDNPRVELAYSPHVIREISERGWIYHIEPDENSVDWGGGEKSKLKAEEMRDILHEISGRMQSEILEKRNKALSTSQTEQAERE